MVDISGLNREQREAVIHFNGPMMILAGAGTGKTRVVTTRIAHMLEVGIAPENIAAMTFTNKAAREMKERIKSLVGSNQAAKLSISTFHSFCLNILRRWPKAAGLNAGFSLLGASDQLDLMRRVIEEKNWHGVFKPDVLLYQIGMCKNALLTPEDLKRGRVPPTLSVQDSDSIYEAYVLYERQLKLNRAIDFDDCILRTVQIFKEDTPERAKLRAQYTYVLVDEFQDTNAAQFAVIEGLASEHRNICVVGDDDQSIYSWRGAMFETIAKFEKVFEGTKIVKLEQNYRCSNVILEAANKVIANNTQRKEKNLWSESRIDFPIVLSSFESQQEEAQWIADTCFSLKMQGYPIKDFAILYRANNQAKGIEMALRDKGLPYKTFGGQSFFERKEIRDFLSYLRLCVQPEDRLALWRVINTPSRGIGLKTQEDIDELAKAKNIPPFRVMEQKLLGSEISDRSRESIADFVEQIQQLSESELNSPADVRELGLRIIGKFKLAEYIKASTKDPMSAFKKLQNLNSLPDWLEKAAGRYVEQHGKLDAKALIDHLTLTDGPQFEREEERSYISLMTIHAAKGLEFSVVFVAGLEEGALPHHNSFGDPQGINEERRLFYVALTRAKERCLLSYAFSRMVGNQRQARQVSRFIAEVPETLLHKMLTKDIREPTEVRAAQTVKKLSALRSALSSS